MVHTAAGDVGNAGMGERLALWDAVVRSLGARQAEAGLKRR